MQKYLAALTFILLIGLVITRVQLLKRKGIAAMQFGKLDKTDFLIPPIALFYFYLVFANAFGFPTPATSQLFYSNSLAWFGVIFCLAGLLLLAWSIYSFGQSFRIGIDIEHPDQLITSGAYAFSRNPIYVAFACVLIGQFLVFSNVILLLYLLAAFWLFHRQVLREEEFLQQHYGQEFTDYCSRVRRYL
jgi:protein-S-isoprenylcysteine O-methyltransferase Ste14